MKKKIAVLTVCAMFFALSFPVEAQQPKTVFRIGYLSSFDPVTDPRIEGIRQSLREFGYIEGQNITIAYRNTEGKLDWLAEFLPPRWWAEVRVVVVVSAGTRQDPGGHRPEPDDSHGRGLAKGSDPVAGEPR